MVNRVLVIVLGAVVLASLVVGGLLGMQLAGGSDDVAPAVTSTPTVERTATPPPPATPTASATRTVTTTRTATLSATATPTETPTPKKAFDPASVNATAVENHLRVLIDERFRDGNDPLEAQATLEEMAQFHADNMAAQGYPSHVAGGYSTHGRYEEYDMYSRCRVPNNNNAGIRDGEELEAVGRVSIDKSAPQNATELARGLFSQWTDGDAKKTLSLTHAEQSGIGITVSKDGRVYATVDLC